MIIMKLKVKKELVAAGLSPRTYIRAWVTGLNKAKPTILDYYSGNSVLRNLTLGSSYYFIIS